MNITELAAELKLSYIRQNYAKIIKESRLTHEEMLLQLLSGEYENRIINGNNCRIKEAKFPYKKYLSDFKRDKYPKEFLPEFEKLETLGFIKENENVILIGTSGEGKTYYAIALGVAACMAGKFVLFANVSNLVTELREIMGTNQITRFRRRFDRYALVILDELGYITFDKAGADRLAHKGHILDTSREKGVRIEETIAWIESRKSALSTPNFRQNGGGV